MLTLLSSPRSKNHHFWPETSYLTERCWNTHRIWRWFQDEWDHNVASHPFSLMTGPCRTGWLSSAGSGLSSGRVRLLSAASKLSFCRLFSDVSLHQWLMFALRTRLIFHLQPASQLFAEPQRRARMCERTAPNDMIRAPPRLMWFFGRVQRPTYQMPPFVHESSLPAELTPLPVCCSSIGWEEIGGVTDQSRCCFASFLPFASLCWSQFVLLFNMCPTLLLQFPGAEE